MQISLIVMRCGNIVISKEFYERIGLRFVLEQHKNGVQHYSTTVNGTVLELYPNKGESPSDNLRLGFTVANIGEIINSFDLIGTFERDIDKVYIVKDPDGRIVELDG